MGYSFEALVDLANQLSQKRDFDGILQTVVQRASRLLEAETASILMVNPSTRNTVKTVIKRGVTEQAQQYHFIQNMASGWILKNHATLLCHDLNDDDRFKNMRISNSPIKNILGAPLSAEGVLHGALLIFNKKAGKSFSEADAEYLQKLAVIATPYVSNSAKLQRYFQAPLSKAALRKKYEDAGMLGKSKKYIALLESIEAAAQCDVRVLLEGQTGTGKERIARSIHEFSERRNERFVAIDCGAIPEHLVESELFGHLKGAFTGANSDRKGLFEEAHKGTLFMDEIANLPLDMQSKLMRALQEGEIRPLGANRPRKVDVRVIAASSRSLKKLVASEAFREDLYYRLHVYPIYVPSLRDRYDDVPLLAEHFTKRFSAQQKKDVTGFDAEIIDFMKDRPWVGNIRELENFVERLVTLTPKGAVAINRKIMPEDLRKEMRKLRHVHDDDRDVTQSLAESMAEFESRIIRSALQKHDGNQSQAARALKIPVQTLRYKIKKLGIE